jgi:hypothetical protein
VSYSHYNMVALTAAGLVLSASCVCALRAFPAPTHAAARPAVHMIQREQQQHSHRQGSSSRREVLQGVVGAAAGLAAGVALPPSALAELGGFYEKVTSIQTEH